MFSVMPGTVDVNVCMIRMVVYYRFCWFSLSKKEEKKKKNAQYPDNFCF